MSVAHTCIYDNLESCRYSKTWYGEPVVSKCKDCKSNPNNRPKIQTVTKEEPKSKISFALKDLIQQGLEIICKENEEFEKENDELKETVAKMNNVITETFSNLTKAKKLLKDFVVLDKDYDWNLQLAYDVEQFLKESE